MNYLVPFYTYNTINAGFFFFFFFFDTFIEKCCPLMFDVVNLIAQYVCEYDQSITVTIFEVGGRAWLDVRGRYG